MTAQMSELKMSSFGPYAGAKRHSASIALSTVHSVEGRAKRPAVPQLCGLMIGTRVAGQGSK